MQRKRKGDACFHSKSGCRWCPDSADNFNFPQEYCLRTRKLSILQYAFLCTSMHFYTFLCIFMYFYAFLCIFCCNSCTFVTIFFCRNLCILFSENLATFSFQLLTWHVLQGLLSILHIYLTCLTLPFYLQLLTMFGSFLQIILYFQHVFRLLPIFFWGQS